MRKIIDMIRLFNDWNIQHWTEGKNVSPGWVNVKCVYCDDDSNHLGWDLEKGYFNCWKCGYHQLEETIGRLLGITDIYTIKNILSGYLVGKISIGKIKKEGQASSVSLPGRKLTKFHEKYLKRRGFDPKYLIKKYGIVGTGPGESWNNISYELRIIIPIFFGGRIVSFQGRDITNQQKERYKACPVEKSVINCKQILYNLDNAKGKWVVVVEGILDVWRMGDGFVASFGTTMTSSQINLLNRRFDKITFLFDSELEAQKKAGLYCAQLSSLGKNVELVQLKKVRDPADLSRRTAEEVRNDIFSMGGSYG